VTGESPDPELTSIDVEPSALTLTVGDTQSLSVTAYYDDGSNEDVTNSAEFESAGGTVTIADNEVTAAEEGSTEVAVTYEGEAETVTVTVEEENGEED